MEEYVAEYNDQSQQQFLSDSPWDHKPVMARIASELGEILVGDEAALVVDENSIREAGRDVGWREAPAEWPATKSGDGGHGTTTSFMRSPV